MNDDIFIFDESGTILKGVKDNSFKSITIPDSITSIGRFAFSGCSNLTSINIPNGVTSIRDKAFHNCSVLTSINIPDGVTSLGRHAFSGCSGLTSIHIPNGVTRIGSHAFAECSNLISVTIPFRIHSIERYTFYGCTSLISIIIPWIDSIERYAFYGCSNLKFIDIPIRIEYIGEHAFDGCPIEKVALPKETYHYPNSFDKMTKMENLKVFISYSWENKEHFAWIDKLANDLNKKVNVILDREEQEPGDSNAAFINEIHEAKKVICILTPDYKRKAETAKGVLGKQEYPIIKNERDNEKRMVLKNLNL